ncbi:CopD family copper resistance protein [Herminiimonas sp. CN]|uniref:CopD family copper resistance protein n=1 Tax=Herminiimonas sp. CN TaxID=1349818 RepID=UPI000473FD0F|nr:membrane protein [Herminiimonas sp. CN]
MSYPILLTLHLFGALMFVGTVFFEVLILEGVRKHLPTDVMRQTERAIGTRARSIMPWVLMALYGAGIGMAWQHRAALAHPFASSFGVLLTLKILLALSVFGHFVTAMVWLRRGLLRSGRSRFIHISVFCHMVGIVLLAKGMFYLH